MKLSEYLTIRGVSPKTLTKPERILIGVADYNPGWPLRYGHLTVPEALVAAAQQPGRTRKTLRLAARALLSSSNNRLGNGKHHMLPHRR